MLLASIVKSMQNGPMFVDFRERKFCAKPNGTASVKGSIAMANRAFAIANASTVLLICGVMRGKVR
jgi:hypothetical protein